MISLIKAYGYKQKLIKNISEIPKAGDHFLNFQGLNFLVKLKPENNNICFIFHGAVSGKGVNRIIFRGYDYNIQNTDIVCICDYLLNKYHEYELNWTLSTKKYNVENIYVSIIYKILKNKKYKNVLFSGTSAGGYPSIKFASKFNENALVSNSQLYLEECGRGLNPKYGFYKLNNMLNNNQDELLYYDKNIELEILKSKPKTIILYNNIMDTTFKRDFIPFINFIIRSDLVSIIDINLFSTNYNYHNISFPNNKSYLSVLTDYFDYA